MNSNVHLQTLDREVGIQVSQGFLIVFLGKATLFSQCTSFHPGMVDKLQVGERGKAG